MPKTNNEDGRSPKRGWPLKASEEAFAKMVHRGIGKQPQTDVTSPKGNWPTSATLPDGELAGETDDLETKDEPPSTLGLETSN
ncbi:hypothetical protein JMJ77_0015023 [Colletotrichum scovillei]|uniref:Uncharacterized protein n=1 Tax=Colletotrichum scovillei TaxID=1209932 RepID=A0A9P7QZD5_9PEZI|nr:hypothetical protein JMJ77_0015023 [Colletotrichum scovillei]KAG7056645.1 hypothetical protein JMJ78_0000438 [Colletotrichum scovillei]KAG7066570.1 hypothetical protein JMJ76_0000427 [Colletotrichum scovillei]